jgi:nicotinamidase-related amidase
MSANFRVRRFALLVALGVGMIPFAFHPAAGGAAQADAKLVLNQRSQQETEKGSGRFHVVTKRALWDAKKTAIVVCDMWDKHWCKGASERVAEMAPRMNEVLKAARARGVLIIHCPSDTMGFYKDTAQRKLAQAAPMVEPKVPLKGWCKLDPMKEGALPIDDSDGGCDCDPRCKNGKAWSRQIDALEIKEGDAITDSAEAYYLMQQRGIENVIVMGVHTNMCVLGRPFAIRQLAAQGKNVVLMRDLTDTMYNSRSKPYVSHFTGTDLVIAHIERNWCPSITSVDFLGGRPFRFKADTRPHLVILAGEPRFHTEKTLTAFAVPHLGKDFRITTVYPSATKANDLPGFEALQEADLVLVSLDRLALPEGQMALLRKLVATGKPIVAVGTATHAFAPDPGKPHPGTEAWETFDREVLGCEYKGEHGNDGAAAPKTQVKTGPEAAKHVILKNVDETFASRSVLTKCPLVGMNATLLLQGNVDGQTAVEPVAWTHVHIGGGRVFCTTLGHPDDFKSPAFRWLLTNGIYWTANRTPPEKLPE